MHMRLGLRPSTVKKRAFFEGVSDAFEANTNVDGTVAILEDEDIGSWTALDLDVVLHKITNDLSFQDTDAFASQVIVEIQRIEEKGVLVLDPICRLIPLLSRRTVYDRIRTTLDTLQLGSVLTCPPYWLIESADEIPSDVSGTIVWKTDVASGRPESHDLTWIQNCSKPIVERLLCSEAVKKPSARAFLAQKFVNHGGIIYKVYVMKYGTAMASNCPQHFISVDVRPSIRDVNESADPTPTCVEFNSQHPFSDDMRDAAAVEWISSLPKEKCTYDIACEDFDAMLGGIRSPATSPHHHTCPTAPPLHVLKAVCLAIHRAFDLTLYGVDLIYSRDDNQWYIVDLNYFPSYSGVADAPQRVLEIVRSHWEAKLQRVAAESG